MSAALQLGDSVGKACVDTAARHRSQAKLL